MLVYTVYIYKYTHTHTFRKFLSHLKSCTAANETVGFFESHATGENIFSTMPEPINVRNDAYEAVNWLKGDCLAVTPGKSAVFRLHD